MLVQRLTQTFFFDYIRDDLNNFLTEHELCNNKALFLDSAPCHLTEPVKETFKEISCNREFIKNVAHKCTSHSTFVFMLSCKAPIMWQVDQLVLIRGLNALSRVYRSYQWLSDVWRDFDSNIINNILLIMFDRVRSKIYLNRA